MSSGKIERNYLKNYEIDSKFDEIAIFNEINSQFSTLTTHKLYQRNINSHYVDYKPHPYNNNLDKDLLIIEKLHYILLNSQNLTQKQKIAYCNSQRFYMKLYLRKITKKIHY
ncbi:MAG: hypothetical protein ACFE91_04070 [Promethearchaeota archaeon]